MDLPEKIAADHLYHIVVDTDRYIAYFATKPEELDAIFTLRYQVFNLELGARTSIHHSSSFHDRDEYDAVFDHIMVLYKPTNQVVGTYRIQTSQMALKNNGFYSENEFDISSLPYEYLHYSLEVGRACIDKEHRNKGILFLLWKMIAKYLVFHEKRYMFGCSSIGFESKEKAAAFLHYFAKNGFMHPTIKLGVTEQFSLDISKIADDESLLQDIKIPELFRIYLKHKANICSLPAYDKMFNTVDFLTLLDINDISPKQYEFFIS